MTVYEIPPPEPKPIDETNWLELKDKLDCWHQQVRILVGGEWWCQWWEAIPAE